MDVALSPNTRSRGFSLIQLISILGIFASSLSLAIPRWTGLIQSNNVQSSRAEMMTLLNYSRSKAVLMGKPVTLCPTSDQENCNNDFTLWHEGYMVFSDRNGNRSRDSGEPILQLSKLQHKGIKIHSSTGRRSIRFDTDGSAWGSNLTLRFCTTNRIQNNRSILLYGTGRPRFSRYLSNGDPVICE